MPVEVARYAGFCLGVRRAVDKAQEATEEAVKAAVPIASLGDIIHNQSVVERLRAKGLKTVGVPKEASGMRLVLRSHGVSRQVEAEARQYATQVIDCTCPFVHSLQRRIAEEGKKGGAVILMGDRQHPEIVGAVGWAEGPIAVIADEDDISALPDSFEGALVLSQTTFSPKRWKDLGEKLKKRLTKLRFHETICKATHERQEAASELAKRADVMLVVGSGHSANTMKLFETVAALCPRTYLVERAEDIPLHSVYPARELIGVTAGASTPDWSLKEVVDSMTDMEHKDQVQQPQEGQPEVDQVAEVAAEAVEAVAEAAAESAPAEAAVEAAAETVTEETPAQAVAETVVETVVEPVAQEPAQTEEAQPAQDAKASFMDAAVADMPPRIRQGLTLTGKVVQLTDDEVCVNIGYKSDGLLSRNDLVDKDVELGDEIEVEIVKVNDGEGNVILSQRNIVNRKIWDEVMVKYEAGELVEAVGKEVVKGGLLCAIGGIRAFVPASHLAQRYVDNIAQFVGKPLMLKVIEADTAKRRIVASRKEALAQEYEAKKAEAFERLKEGDVVRGIVRRFATFGAFVDLGGVDGLIHITDISWGRTAQPSDVLHIGQEVDVKILSLDEERGRIQLGYKQLQPRPWDNIEEKYPVGDVLVRKVVRIRPFGAFIELEPGVDGLVHISQVARERVEKVEDVLQQGQDVAVKVLAVDPVAKRISLSIREAMEDNASFETYSDYIPGIDAVQEEHINTHPAILEALSGASFAHNGHDEPAPDEKDTEPEAE